LTGES